MPAHHCVSYHPDHEVGEEGYPERGGQEGEQVPALPPRQATVWDGAVKQEAHRPREQPLQTHTPTIWRNDDNMHKMHTQT